jgi:hypothetical protein
MVWYIAQRIALSFLHPTHCHEATRDVKSVTSFRSNHTGTNTLFVCELQAIANQFTPKALALIYYEELKVPSLCTSSCPVPLREDTSSFKCFCVRRVGSAILGRFCQLSVGKSFEASPYPSHLAL